jgi:magnesium transporter
MNHVSAASTVVMGRREAQPAVIEAKVEVECPICDTTIPSDAKTCPGCGAALSDAGIEDLEDRIISDDQQDILPEISGIRRSLIYLRRQLTSEIDMLEKLIRPDIEFFSNRSRAYLRDSMERFDRVLHFAEVNRELMAALVDTYLSVLSNRMNRIFASQNTVMQRLTVITAIFMPLSLLAGIYGMNFVHMPELNWSFGYFLVLVVMVTTGIGLYVYFKRIGWLD